MEGSTTKIEAIRAIVNPLFTQADDEMRLADFYLHLSKQTFRPHPRQFKTLSIIGAIGRWHDLKYAVQQQLSNEVTSRWAVFGDTLEGGSEEKTPAENEFSNDTSDQTLDPALDLPTATLPKTDTGNTKPYLRINTRRDWFDILLDFVAAFIKPAYASSK
jgi:hypothetical protein